MMPGRGDPVYSAAACALFGFADAVGLRMQGQGLPNQLADIAPYVVTLAALAISHRKRVRNAVVSASALEAAPGATDPG